MKGRRGERVVNHMCMCMRLGLYIRVWGAFTGRQTESGLIGAKSQGGSFILRREPRCRIPLLVELLDHVVDLLHDAEYTSRNCRLASKL